ncbi:MAG: 1-acyl-sn-glycerol-3-phosphate acyltransferase [Ketobacteraceae bacterium]|nr:1-acyl-sn-glycerol-3-phosphate acyltransferase [Ketobacteraceae bacterium]
MSYNKFYAFAQTFVAPVVRGYSRLEVCGASNLPEPGRGALLACNHSGSLWWDALCLISALPDRQLQFIAHHWDAKVPAIKAMLDLVDCSFLDACEHDIDEQCEVVERLRAGEQMCIYPEESYHSFRHRYTLFQFSPHVIRYARAADVPVIPVGIVGVEEAAPTLFGFKKAEVPLHIPLHPPVILPVKVTIEIGEPVSVASLAGTQGDDADVDEMANRLRQRVATLINRHRPCHVSDEKYIHRQSWF